MERCMVCLQDLCDGEVLTIQCGHKFHQSCILNWFRSPQCSGNCPLCNDNPHNVRPNRRNYYYFNAERQIHHQRFIVVKRELKKQKNIDERDKKILQTIQDDGKQVKDLEQTIRQLKKDESYNKIKKEIEDKQKQMWRYKNKILTNKIKLISKQPIIFF